MKTNLDHRNLYHFAIFIVGLQMLLSIAHIIVISLGGSSFIYFSGYFVPWFILIVISAVALQLVLIWYYRIKNFRFALLGILVSLVATLAYGLFFYLALTNRFLQNMVAGAYVMVLFVGSIYSLCLFTSGTRHRFWLFWAGISGFLVQCILIALYLWGMNTQNDAIQGGIKMAIPWLSVAGSLTLFFYTLNFKDELNSLDNKDELIPSKLLTATMNLFGVISVIAIFLVLNQGIKSYVWQNGKAERSMKLAQLFEARIYVNGQNDTLRYRLLKPKDYDINKEYPLVVDLHHGAGMGNDNLIQLDAAEPSKLLSTDENRKKYPAFIIVPQCPKNSSFRELPKHQGISDLIYEAMNTVEEEFNIDERRRYVMGLSLGGYGTWHFIGSRPELFAAAIPICGGGDPGMANNMINVPIWAFHGENDNNVPVHLTRNVILAIRVAGGSPKYTEYSSGHDIWNKVYNTPGLLEWLFAQKKE
ncbi:prolyl oligopeptidase family serine peptidase [Arenibacter sp. F26102]|uniref:carboxylesterase family protein n=1 Tax=Arenibacter sp. F26102 TaxID=2926416 RepID=UPI001FF36034|nr:prolyl oligopeptidase family serine peptidase [Arenibacter sp. F26102]MCK0146710.1 prolyl oligopeptidase family serine peptidase [Arenibacter sp. F26102]